MRSGSRSRLNATLQTVFFVLAIAAYALALLTYLTGRHSLVDLICPGEKLPSSSNHKAQTHR